MYRRGLTLGAVVLGLILMTPSFAAAFFPPGDIKPTVGTPPDPFRPPTGGGLGEPETPAPGPGPHVNTPEPATVVTALTGLAFAAGYRLQRRAKAA